jgi:catechol 2,3-dioxygenase-like lactoylglutathione lyase family enzyme
MFTGFQVNLYADDVEPGVAFYAALGFEETYRYAPAGEPLHVDRSCKTVSGRSVDPDRHHRGGRYGPGWSRTIARRFEVCRSIH